MEAIEVLEAIEARLEMIGLELKQQGKHDPRDIYFDCINAVKEVRALTTT